MSNSIKHFLFHQIDSWFFRESRSMDGAGSTALESIFPPANNTLMGAVRTQIGNQYHAKHKTDWTDFKTNSDLQKIIGFGNDYASLKTQGAWLYNEAEKQLYFPLPAIVVQQGKDEKNLETEKITYDFFKLPQNLISCDLGNVRLPELKKRDKDKRDKEIGNAYISCKELNNVLQGSIPKNISKLTKVIKAEPRLGIERDNQRRKTIDGKLYQTKHIRLKKDWCLYLGVAGLHEDYQPTETVLRLGGEARMAELKPLASAPKLPQPPTAKNNNDYLVIYLLTPLPDTREQQQAVLPNASFKQIEQGGSTIWQGKINNIDIDIISAITGKPERIGGWDMVNHQSLPVRSFIPAGSCWYIKSNGNTQDIINALHGTFITQGNDRALGYGQVVVGLAPTQSN